MRLGFFDFFILVPSLFYGDWWKPFQSVTCLGCYSLLIEYNTCALSVFNFIEFMTPSPIPPLAMHFS